MKTRLAVALMGLLAHLPLPLLRGLRLRAQALNSGMSGRAPHSQKPRGSAGNWRGRHAASSSISHTPDEYS